MTGELRQGRRVTLRALEPDAADAAAADTAAELCFFVKFLALGLVPLLSGLDDIFS